MIDLGSVDIYIPLAELSKSELEKFSDSLFDSWEKDIDNFLSVPDYSILLVVEDGSLSVKGKIAATAATLYLGIAQYGSFISGLDIIYKQSTRVVNFLTQKSTKNFNDLSSAVDIKKSRGDLGKIKYLVEKYQSGQLSVDEVMERISEILVGVEGNPDFLDEIEASLRAAPLYPQQRKLDFYEFLAYISEENFSKKRKLPIGNIPRNSLNFRDDRFRVELWRNSKNDKKNVKIIKI